LILPVKKQILYTKVARIFLETLEERAKLQYARIEERLAEEGCLNAPNAEKLAGYANLFAIRVTHGQNVRVFYCYDMGDAVYVLSGYEKKTEDIPVREIKQALRLKKELKI